MRERGGVADSEAGRAEPFKSFDSGCGNTGFGVRPAGCFVPLFPHCGLVPPFWNGNIYSVSLYVGTCDLFFIFYFDLTRVIVKKMSWVSLDTLNFGLLNNIEILIECGGF